MASLHIDGDNVKIPSDANHMVMNDAHATTIHNTGKISGRVGGGTTNDSIMCKLIMRKAEHGRIIFLKSSLVNRTKESIFSPHNFVELPVSEYIRSHDQVKQKYTASTAK